MSSEVCAICGEEEEDWRMLHLSYFYALQEVSPKLQPENGSLHTSSAMHEIRTCKACRGEFFGVLRRWCDGAFIDPVSRGDTDDPERNIPVRVDGRTVMMTMPEYHEWRLAQGAQP
jgi:hypothetical protein